MKPFNSADPTTWVSEEMPTDEAITKCPLPACSRSLTQGTQKRHMEQFHFRDGISEPCGLCPSPKPGAFATPFNFMRHIKRMHSSATTKYRCNWPKCGSTKNVRDKSDVLKHIGTAHQRNAVCGICKESCPTKYFLSHTCHHMLKKSVELVDSDDDFVEMMPRRRAAGSSGGGSRKGQETSMGTENYCINSGSQKTSLPVVAGGLESAEKDEITEIQTEDVTSVTVQCENQEDGFVAFKCDICHSRFSDVAAVLEHKAKCGKEGLAVAVSRPAPAITPAIWRAERGRVDHIDVMVDGLVNGANKATQTSMYSQDDGDLRQKLEREIAGKDAEIAGLKRQLAEFQAGNLKGHEDQRDAKTQKLMVKYLAEALESSRRKLDVANDLIDHLTDVHSV